MELQEVVNELASRINKNISEHNKLVEEFRKLYIENKQLKKAFYSHHHQENATAYTTGPIIKE